jgi:non-heme chloroperoxidase
MVVRHTMLMVLFAFSCVLQAQEVASPWRDPSPHATQFIEVEPEVQIEVLDWGGDGRAVLLLAGLGNTAHIYDNFAAKLTERFRVYGITRRGFGESSKPQTGFDVGRLADDLASIIGKLGTKRPIVIGHSFAGDELTELGARHPTIVGGLIYLDAAADRTTPVPEEYARLVRTLPPASNAQSQAYESYAAMAAYANQPESEIRQKFRETENGRLSSRVEPRIVQAIVAGIKRPAYASVSAPALAIFAIPPSPGALFPWIVTEDPIVQKNMTSLYELNLANIRRQMATFDNEVVQSQAIELAAGHNVYVTNEADVLKAIFEFAAAHPGGL